MSDAGERFDVNEAGPDTGESGPDFDDSVDVAIDREIGESRGEVGEAAFTETGEVGYERDEFDDTYDEAVDREAGVRQIKCRREDLEGKTHPDTGVPYGRERVDINGETVEGVFPKLDSVYDTQLPKCEYLERDEVQFDTCNEDLYEHAVEDLELRSKFTKEQFAQIENGYTPDGFTWHHHQEQGKMQLVDRETHRNTGHTGGKHLWGGLR